MVQRSYRAIVRVLSPRAKVSSGRHILADALVPFMDVRVDLPGSQYREPTDSSAVAGCSGLEQFPHAHRSRSIRMTSRLRGPCTPTAKVSSMSAVREGPVMNEVVVGRR